MTKVNLIFQSYAMEQADSEYVVTYCGSEGVERLWKSTSKRQAKKTMIALAEALDVGESLSTMGYPECSDKVAVYFHMLNAQRKASSGKEEAPVEKANRDELLKRVRYEVKSEKDDLYGVYEIGWMVRDDLGWTNHLITHKTTLEEAEILVELLRKSFRRGVEKGIRQQLSSESLAFLRHLVEAERFGTFDAIVESHLVGVRKEDGNETI